MDVIIVSRSGVLNTPHLIENMITAEATFDVIAKELLKEDYDQLDRIVDYGEKLEEANRLLEYTGIEIHWFTDVKINKHKNR